MKNKLIIVLIIILFLCGCNKNSKSLFISLMADNANDYHTVSDTLLINASQSSISVKYPMFKSKINDCSELNNLIQVTLKDVVEKMYGSDFSGLTLDVKYDVKFLNNHYISIVFTGISNTMAAAHPSNVCFSINVKIDDMQTIVLSDLVKIDDSFIQKFKEYLNEQTNEESAKYFSNHTDDDFKKELNCEYTYCYFTNDNLGIILATPHAIGDFVDIILPLALIS